MERFFDSQGIEIDIPILTALDATVHFARRYRSVAVYLEEEAAQYFQSCPQSEHPEAAIVGDMGAEWSYSVLNRIFRQVMDGADLVAMQINRFWKSQDELILDAGPFVAALEYATSKKSILVGKPSPIFFNRALELAGARPDSEFLMIGDDLNADIAAAQGLGSQGILVMTGKTTGSELAGSEIDPDFVVKDLFQAVDQLRSMA